MRAILPVPISLSAGANAGVVLTSSDLVSGLPDWAEPSNPDFYEAGDVVQYLPTTAEAETYGLKPGFRRAYRANQGITELTPGHDQTPATSVGAGNTLWTFVGFPSDLRPYDLALNQKSTRAGSINLAFDIEKRVTAVALFGILADEVRVQVFDDTAAQVYDQTQNGLEIGAVTNWLEWINGSDPYNARSEMVFEDLPGEVGYSVQVTISAASGDVTLSEIVFGDEYRMAETVQGTSIENEDFSEIVVGAFETTISLGGYTRVARYKLEMTTQQVRRNQTIFSDNRGVRAVFFIAPDKHNLGTTVYGFASRFTATPRAGEYSSGTVELKGLLET